MFLIYHTYQTVTNITYIVYITHITCTRCITYVGLLFKWMYAYQVRTVWAFILPKDSCSKKYLEFFFLPKSSCSKKYLIYQTFFFVAKLYILDINSPYVSIYIYKIYHRSNRYHIFHNIMDIAYIICITYIIKIMNITSIKNT